MGCVKSNNSHTLQKLACKLTFLLILNIKIILKNKENFNKSEETT